MRERDNGQPVAAVIAPSFARSRDLEGVETLNASARVYALGRNSFAMVALKFALAQAFLDAYPHA